MIYFVRHGETDSNAHNRVHGWSDTSLNEKGISQCERTADKTAKLKLAHFYCSDLRRTRQTAEILNKNLGMKINFDKRLRERNSGDMEGRLRSEIPKELREDFWANPHKYNAESFEDFFNRVLSFVREVILAKNLDEALIVTHGGTIKIFTYCYNNTEWNKDEFFKQFPFKSVADNASVTELAPAGFQHWNEPAINNGVSQ